MPMRARVITRSMRDMHSEEGALTLEQGRVLMQAFECRMIADRIHAYTLRAAENARTGGDDSIRRTVQQDQHPPTAMGGDSICNGKEDIEPPSGQNDSCVRPRQQVSEVKAEAPGCARDQRDLAFRSPQ
jgi:hypothetical protein